MTRRITLLFAALLVVFAAACGGSGVEESGGDGGDEVKGADVTDEDDGEDEDASTTTVDDDEDEDDGDGDDGDVPPGQDPEQILGEDPEFDPLIEDCFDGNLFACDALFIVTDVGSDAERYAETCGGRLDSGDILGGECAEEFDAEVPDGLEPGELGDDADLDRLAEGCFDGDFDDCDELFADSPIDSDYEAYAEACGGRLSNNDLGFDFDCVQVFELG
jgi:hypothetical protein